MTFIRLPHTFLSPLNLLRQLWLCLWKNTVIENLLKITSQSSRSTDEVQIRSTIYTSPHISLVKLWWVYYYFCCCTSNYYLSLIFFPSYIFPILQEWAEMRCWYWAFLSLIYMFVSLHQKKVKNIFKLCQIK